MSSRTVPTVSIDFLRLYPLLSATASIILALVRVPDIGMVGGLLSVGGSKLSVSD